ncbi:MAG TPA: hypothetical protein VLA82_13825 [Actinomycetota bacterium]|nr:hypothetical protein [Actinomycetota bacterium]
MDLGEVVDDVVIAERMQPEPDDRAARGDVPTEHLGDADLGGPLRSVLVADHPQGGHARGVEFHPGAHLERALHRCPQTDVVLLLTDHGGGMEAVLARRRSERAGEHAVWIDETRVVPSNSGHQGSWSGSIRRTSPSCVSS